MCTSLVIEDLVYEAKAKTFLSRPRPEVPRPRPSWGVLEDPQGQGQVSRTRLEGTCTVQIFLMCCREWYRRNFRLLWLAAKVDISRLIKWRPKSRTSWWLQWCVETHKAWLQRCIDVVIIIIIIIIIHEFHRDASLEQNFRAAVCHVLQYSCSRRTVNSGNSLP